MTPRWRVLSPDQLLWADCGDAFAVFHRPSGKTHFVNLATALLLREVLVAPTTAEQAAVQLAKAAGVADGTGSPPPVVELLQHLETQGLVERLDP